MGLKYAVEDINEVDEPLRGNYVERDGRYVLDVEGVVSEDEVSGLKSALEKERENAKTAKTEAAKQRDKLEALRTERDKLLDGAGGDEERERIRKHYDQKLTETKTEYEDRIQKLTGTVQNLTADHEAESLAVDLAVDTESRPTLKRLISDRLGVKMTDEGPQVFVKDAEGKESEMKVEDLRKELLEDKSLARLVTDNRASGGRGATGNNGPGRPSTTKSTASLSGSRKDRKEAIRARFPDLE